MEYLIVASTAAILGLLFLFMNGRELRDAVSMRGVVVTLSPALINIVLFYSVAIHLYLANAGWPERFYGVRISRMVSIHSGIQDLSLILLLLLTCVGWPIALSLFTLAKSLRRWRCYLGVYLFGIAGFFLALATAPKSYLHWWNDKNNW